MYISTILICELLLLFVATTMVRMVISDIHIKRTYIESSPPFCHLSVAKWTVPLFSRGSQFCYFFGLLTTNHRDGVGRIFLSSGSFLVAGTIANKNDTVLFKLFLIPFIFVTCFHFSVDAIDDSTSRRCY